MRIVILSVFLLSSFQAFAASKKLANFVPGAYKLTEGSPDRCGDGDFKMHEDGQGIQLGQFHGFNTRTSSVVLKSDIPDEAGCNYDVRDKVSVLGKETVVSFDETLRCPGAIRHTLSRKAKLSATKVEILIDQKGNPDFEDEETYAYRCVFVKK